MNKRYRSYALWCAILAFIPLLFEALGAYDINLILPDNYAKLFQAFLGILVLAGILSSPTTKNKGFLDD